MLFVFPKSLKDGCIRFHLQKAFNEMRVNLSNQRVVCSSQETTYPSDGCQKRLNISVVRFVWNDAEKFTISFT